VVDPPDVDLGSVARESAILRRITLLNVTRGYTIAMLSTTQPWLETYPTTVHLWAGRPVDIRVSVHAEGLPFRSKQLGSISIQAEDQVDEVPVTAQVSLWREVWRLIRRAIIAAVPEGWRMFMSAFRTVRRVTTALRKPFIQRPWILWLVWFLVSAGLGLSIYFAHADAMWPSWLQGVRTLVLDQLPEPLEIGRAVLMAVLGPPGFCLLLWLIFALATPLVAAALGALRGAFKSFFR
jgi:hypothetical protein